MRRKAFVFLLMTVLLFSCATPREKKVETVFYPPLPQRPRLQFLHSITTEEDIGRKRSAFEEWLTGKSPPKKIIGKPYDIGASKGKIYVLDRVSRKLIILDLANRKFDYLRDKRLGTLNDPSGIWVTQDDIKYVADMKRKQIVVFGGDNEYLRAYGDKGVFGKPVDVAIYENRVYVCDMGKSRIFVLDKDTGKVKRTIGKSGAEEGSFYKPTHVTVDHKGNIYVNDSFNFRVQKFDSEGKFLKSFGFLGDALGSFARPKGLAIDKKGHLYVADAAFENVQIFDDETGRLLLFIGGFGPVPGSMYLPSGIYIDYDNLEYFSRYEDKDFRLKYLVYVANMYGNHKLNVYGFGDWVGQPLPGEETESGKETGGKEKAK